MPPSVLRELSGSYLRSRCVFTSHSILNSHLQDRKLSPALLNTMGVLLAGYEESHTTVGRKEGKGCSWATRFPGTFFLWPPHSLLPASSGMISFFPPHYAQLAPDPSIPQLSLTPVWKSQGRILIGPAWVRYLPMDQSAMPPGSKVP